MGEHAVFRADREHEYPAHRGHRAAIGVAIDRDTDWRSLARPEVSHDLCRNRDTGGGLAAQLDDGSKFHHVLLSSDNFSFWHLAARLESPGRLSSVQGYSPSRASLLVPRSTPRRAR